MARVAIVMPVWNPCIEWMKESVLSIIEQKYKDWVLVIVNDGGLRPGSILNDDLDRIKYIEKVHGGLGDTLNYGFNWLYETGSDHEYEAWIAHDDKFYPDCLNLLVSELDGNKSCPLAYGGCDFMDGDNPHSLMSDAKWQEIYFKRNYEPNKLIEKYYLPANCFMWRRSLHEKVGPFQVEDEETCDFLLKCEEHGGYNFHWVNKSMGVFRSHPGTLTSWLLPDDMGKPKGTPEIYKKRDARVITKWVRDKARARRAGLSDNIPKPWVE